MAREILFRGKPKRPNDYYWFSQIYKDDCKDGFVYGSLIVSGERYYICFGTVGQKINCCVNNSTCSVCEIIPETAGQYIGSPDKNGKKIFEGDIIKGENYIHPFYDDRPNVIFWCQSKGGFQLDAFNMPDIEVIGNKYDNPELLEARE